MNIPELAVTTKGRYTCENGDVINEIYFTHEGEWVGKVSIVNRNQPDAPQYFNVLVSWEGRKMERIHLPSFSRAISLIQEFWNMIYYAAMEVEREKLVNS